ncbi:MAG: ABC transporter permease [Gammaproteobacteria bacterium]|nr:ABC transporter permease [Gammaproteobacteria bacterium]
MSFFGLMWASLFRKRTRTLLTLLSLMIAFLLFMLLQSISNAFASSGSFNLVGIDRLVVAAKYSIIDSMPMSQKQQILNIEGVAEVTHSSWFGGIYQEPRNFFPKFPIEPYAYFSMFPELVISKETLDTFAQTRRGVVVASGLADEYGWEPGDIIPIQGDIYAMRDGSRLWEFELVGTFTALEGESESPLFLFQYDYFTEAVAEGRGDQVGQWTVRLNDSDKAAEIANEIDKLFENSQDPTRTATEDEASRQFASQLGDIGFITSMIMGAVFFTIVLLTGNTMSQALRERIPELAVLKTVGFTDGVVSLLVLGEAVLLCVVGGVLGIGLAFIMQNTLESTLGGFIGNFEYSASLIASAVTLAIAIGVVIGSLPALSARRLTIVDALRER